MKYMLTVAALVVAATMAEPAVSWPPQPQQQPKFSATTELVLVPVLVRRNAQHVTGLKKEDFALQADRKNKDITVFEEVHAVMPTAMPKPTVEEFTNVRPREAVRITVIALDLLNTPPLDQAYMRQEVLKFLDTAADTGEPFSLVAITHDGVHVLQDFTTDPRLIVAAVRKQAAALGAKETLSSPSLAHTPCAVSGGGCGNSSDDTAAAASRELQNWLVLLNNEEGFEVYRDRNARLDTLAALQQLAQSLSGVPGRKTLIWATSGITALGGMARLFSGASPEFGGSEFSPTGTNSARVSAALEENMRTFQLLSAAGVAVYPLDARHGANTLFESYDVGRADAPVGDRGFAGERGLVRNQDQEKIQMFQQIAAATGGKPCFNRTDLANCLKEDAADAHDYYILGFYADKDSKAGWHKLDVKLVNQKADVRYRSGFISQAADPEKSRMTDLQLAMVSPLPYTGVAVTGHFIGVQPGKDKRDASFALDLPPQAVTVSESDGSLNFDIIVVARGADGKEAAKLGQRVQRKLTPEAAAQIRAEGIHYTNKLALGPGTYGVWFVIRDNVTGRTGSVMAPLTVQ